MTSFSRLQPVTIILAIVGVLVIGKYNAALIVSTKIQLQGSVSKSVLQYEDKHTKLKDKEVEHVAPSAGNSSTAFMEMADGALTIHTGSKVNDNLVQQGDFVYERGNWDGSPVVLEQYNLIFFTTAKVGCTIWKQLFRRIMGEKDWRAEATKGLLPWNPEINGLKYLYDYDRETASRMMTSPEYTRAIFVRDPKERLLSAYLDKGVGNGGFMFTKCCPSTLNCTEAAKESLSSFFDLIQWCRNNHWSPQSRRMQGKYWPYINFVGNMESVAADAERLLRQVGAWDQFGKSGWGEVGNMSIFGTKSGGAGRTHATNARDRLRVHYTPELEKKVDLYYASDYANSFMNLTRMQIYRD
jgi:hypothetical protein